jgi:hypothetical protein
MDEHIGMYTTMSIASLGPSTLDKKPRSLVRLNRNQDSIDVGAAPSTKSLRYNKASMMLTVNDIDGAQSKFLHRERKGYAPEIFTGFSRRSDIICSDGMAKTLRCINPLNPEYVLPSFTPAAPQHLKYVRDSFDVSDIDGAKPRSIKIVVARDTMRVDDIEGASSTWKPRHERIRLEFSPRNNLDVSDISKVLRTQIATKNPLEPEYYIHGMHIGQKFRATPNKNYLKDNMLLKTRDINYPPPDLEVPTRREFRNTNFILDIDGAQADTIRHGVRSSRNTNPLLPVYKSLDFGKILDNPVHSLLPAAHVTMPTFNPSKTHSVQKATEGPAPTSPSLSDPKGASPEKLQLNLGASFSQLSAPFQMGRGSFESHDMNFTPSRSFIDRHSNSLKAIEKIRISDVQKEIQSVRDLN